MYSPFVAVPGPHTVEALSTELTFVRPGIGVNVQMLPKFGLLRKAFGAGVTFEGLLFVGRMNVQNVKVQFGLVQTRFAAHRARHSLVAIVLLLSLRLGRLGPAFMLLLVVQSLVIRVEGFGAVFARMGLLTGVGVFVILHFVLFKVAFVAKLALKRSLIRGAVNPYNMPFQTLTVRKSLAAMFTGELTLVKVLVLF